MNEMEREPALPMEPDGGELNAENSFGEASGSAEVQDGGAASDSGAASEGGAASDGGAASNDGAALDSGDTSGADTQPEERKEKKPFLRGSGSWTDIIPIAAMLSVVMILVGDLISLVLTSTVIPAEQIGMNLLGDADSVEFLMQYFDFFGIWIAFMLVILLFKDNWPMWKAFLYNRHGNNLKSILAGILLGFGLNGSCVLVSWIMGDIKLSYSGFSPVPFFTFLACVLIQSGAEEIVDRCYLYQKLRRRYRWPIIAIVVNALIFMSLHMGNPGVTNLGLLQVFLIGVLFSLIIYFWDSLWTVIWAHTAWNFSQSIVFGLPNSGLVSKYSVFKLEAASARDGLFYNTGFGIEGSLGANAMIGAVILLILLYALVTKRGERVDYWKELEARNAGKSHIWEAVVLTLIMASVIAACIFANLWLEKHSDEIEQFIESQVEEAAQESQPAEPAEDGTQAQPAPESQPAEPTQEGTQAQPAPESQQAEPAQDGTQAQPTPEGQQAEPARDGTQTQPSPGGQKPTPAQDNNAAAEPAQEDTQAQPAP